MEMSITSKSIQKIKKAIKEEIANGNEFISASILYKKYGINFYTAKNGLDTMRKVGELEEYSDGVYVINEEYK